MLIENEPADIIQWLLINEWDESNIDIEFDPHARISTGWWDESHSKPQLTLSGTDEDTSPTGMDPSTGRLTSWVDGVIWCDVWVAGDRDVLEGTNPKTVRWQLRREVHRIIGENQSGTTTEDGEPELTRLETGTVTEPPVEDDETPAIYRFRVPIGYHYHARP